MEGFLQEALDFARAGGQKIYPIIDLVSVKISTFIDVATENVHLIILLAISMYISSIFSGRDLGLRFWAVTIALFFGLRYLGF